MYKWDIYQVYRALKDYDSHGKIIQEGTLVQIWKYEGSSIGIKTEDDNRYWIQANDLLNQGIFKKVF